MGPGTGKWFISAGGRGTGVEMGGWRSGGRESKLRRGVKRTEQTHVFKRIRIHF